MRIKFYDGSNSFIIVEGNTFEECICFVMQSNEIHAVCRHEVIKDGKEEEVRHINSAKNPVRVQGTTINELDRD